MQKKLSTVIVGRPNVGKSSLFNKLVRRKIGNNKAIVFSERGTTIDYKADYSHILECDLIDTAGLSDDLRFSQLCNRQTELAIQNADCCIFMIDGKVGVTSDDLKYSKFLRKIRDDIPVILVINKCDAKAFKDTDEFEPYKLGFGEGILFSTEHNIGIGELIFYVNKYLREIEEKNSIFNNGENDDINNKVINLSIVGRQNVGKSTLLNRLFGDERVIVSPVAGTTRDTISVDIPFSDFIIRVSDTAGVRRRDYHGDKIEQMSIQSTMISLQFANVAILVIDGTVGFERQDLIIGEEVLNEGRALIVAINKSDEVKNKNNLLESLQVISKKYLANAQVFMISAKNGYGCEKIYHAVVEIYNQWLKRITTSKLNRWLRSVILEHEHKLSKNRRSIKIKFITQYDIRPPRFFISVNRPDEMDESYKRYIINQLRSDFNFNGVPIRIEFHATKNPYHDKEESKVKNK